MAIPLASTQGNQSGRFLTRCVGVRAKRECDVKLSQVSNVLTDKYDVVLVECLARTRLRTEEMRR
jgi:hypothetical protein